MRIIMCIAALTFSGCSSLCPEKKYGSKPSCEISIKLEYGDY